MRRILLVIGLMCAVSCGSSPSTPSAPAIVQLAGVWRGTVRLNTVSGGDCVGPIFQSAAGTTSAFTASITQSGAALSATVTDPATGGNCAYTGTAGTSAFTLNVNSCSSSNIFGLRCASGASRDLILLTGAINGTASGSSVTGTEAETYNVLVSGTGTGAGTLVLNSSFNGTRQ